MEKIDWIHSFRINPKSAFRNFKFAMLLCAVLFALSFVGALLFALCLSAEAQQTKKILRIGYLSPFAPASEPSKLIFEAFHQGLRELGWIPGKNLTIEYRWADEKYDRLPELATELVRLNVDAIYAVTVFAA